MGLFKKKPAPMVVDLKCPVDGCGFVAEEQGGLDKHIAWKHPDHKK